MLMYSTFGDRRYGNGNTYVLIKVDTEKTMNSDHSDTGRFSRFWSQILSNAHLDIRVIYASTCLVDT